jgi:hypothetical protein
MKTRTGILLVLLFVLPAVAFTQVVYYDVIVAGHSIGAVKVYHYQATTRKQRIEAEFKVPFYSGTFFSENNFNGGGLKNSVTEHHVNGKRKQQTVTTFVANKSYKVDFAGDEKATKQLSQHIASTITNLYYQEPVDLDAVYSERYGKLCTLKKVGANRYAISLPNGKQSIYTYDSGGCQEVLTELSGVKVRIVKRDVRLASR